MSEYSDYLEKCMLCPRQCGINRYESKGFCGAGSKIKLSRAALHYMEEPCISGTKGSGTIFFADCNMKCVFCQNHSISHNGFGKEVESGRFAEICLELQEKGANNINLVTPTMYVPMIVKEIKSIKDKLHIPVVYNTGGYESRKTISLLEGVVNIYLTDIKYFDDEIAIKYSAAPDYFMYAKEALVEMINQVGKPEYYNFNGQEMLLKKGVIVRHLVMPGNRKDSLKIVQWLGENINPEDYVISLMSQYTPGHGESIYPELNRRITSFEYESVVKEAIKYNIVNGYMQERNSAGKEYTPDFNLEGVDDSDNELLHI